MSQISKFASHPPERNTFGWSGKNFNAKTRLLCPFWPLDTDLQIPVGCRERVGHALDVVVIETDGEIFARRRELCPVHRKVQGEDRVVLLDDTVQHLP